MRAATADMGRVSLSAVTSIHAGSVADDGHRASADRRCRVADESQIGLSAYRRPMPEVSRFYGIIITINFDDHQPPHFHARYGEHRAALGMDGTVLAGGLPARALLLVRTWSGQHLDELMADWELARALRPLAPIAPLD